MNDIEINSINGFIDEIFRIQDDAEKDRFLSENDSSLYSPLVTADAKKMQTKDSKDLTVSDVASLTERALITDENGNVVYSTDAVNYMNNGVLLYRGEPSDYGRTSLMPTVFRRNKPEDFYYHETLRRCYGEIRGENILQKLVYMQHYGSPTRLLDVSYSPLTALYFACEDAENNDDVGIVYVFYARRKSILYEDNQRAHVLSVLPMLDDGFKHQLLNSAIHTRGKLYRRVSGRYSSDVIDRLCRCVSEAYHGFSGDIIPEDILNPAFISPGLSNARITAQNGAFILPGLSKDGNGIVESIKTFRYKRIVVRNRKTIFENLKVLGIDKAFLYPEIEKVSEYLN